MRSLKRTDEKALGDYFLGLSEKMKSLFAPHRFDRETAKALSRGKDEARALRFIALCRGRIVGYVILAPEMKPGDAERYGRFDGAGVCAVGPSVADDFQDRGLGTQLFEYVLDIARALGKKKMVLMGGVQARNKRAVHFYRKFGFNKVGEFHAEFKCYNMVLDL